ncbi:unnamed protein product, partial [Prorocentrum cordatum]
KGEQWQRALALLSEMWEAKLDPNVVSYSAGISACEKGEQWQRALALLSEMWEVKLEPDSATSLRPALLRCRCSARCGNAMWRRTTSVTMCAPPRMRGRLAMRQDFQAIMGSVFRVFACLAKLCACGNLFGNHCDYVGGHPNCEFARLQSRRKLLRTTLHGSALVGFSGEISICRERGRERERERRAVKAGHAAA